MSSTTFMAPPTDSESTKTDTSEHHPTTPTPPSKDGELAEELERRLTLDDQASSAKGTNADKPAMKTSSAASTGSRTSSRAELLTSPKDCLYHADGDRVAELAMAPINSTGDIYHIIAYLFLAECCIPNVTLMHDSTNDAKKCNDLCHKFTECFKFPHGTIKVQEIEQNGCHQNPRQDAARKFFPCRHNLH